MYYLESLTACSCELVNKLLLSMRGREAVLRTLVTEKFHSMMMIYDFYDMAKEGDEWP